MLTLSEVLAYLTGAHRMTEPELIHTFGPEVQEAVGHLKMLGLVEKVVERDIIKWQPAAHYRRRLN